jgi:hypothetical protein
MKGKTYKIDLLPEDFVNGNYIDSCFCALAKAMKRYFEVSKASCDDEDADIEKDGKSINFTIVDRFTSEDYDFVEEQYRDPNHDTIYYVTLKEY